MTGLDIVNAAVKQKGEEVDGEDNSEGKRSAQVSHSMIL
jgi:hypothetical protein